MSDETVAVNFRALKKVPRPGCEQRASRLPCFRGASDQYAADERRHLRCHSAEPDSAGIQDLESSQWEARLDEPLALLADQWVEECQVRYIGLARSGSRRTVLRRRLSPYRRTGAGAADNHAGGVQAFQLEDAADLRVCWRASSGSAALLRQQCVTSAVDLPGSRVGTA